MMETIDVKRNHIYNQPSLIISERIIKKQKNIYHILKEFAERDINLTKIESRPSKRKLGEYLFFVDFEGSLDDKKVKDALSSIKEKTPFLKILGSY